METDHRHVGDQATPVQPAQEAQVQTREAPDFTAGQVVSTASETAECTFRS